MCVCVCVCVCVCASRKYTDVFIEFIVTRETKYRLTTPLPPEFAIRANTPVKEITRIIPKLVNQFRSGFILDKSDTDSEFKI